MWALDFRQGYDLSPLLFIVYMNWIDKCSQADECAMIGNCKISRLVFADDLVLLSSSESGLQCALNSFADACNTARIKISTAITEGITSFWCNHFDTTYFDAGRFLHRSFRCQFGAL